MPKTMKQRIYTYDQLDAILQKRGSGPNKHGHVVARLYSSMHAVARHENYLRLARIGSGGSHGFTLAYVWKVAGGDTVYAVASPSDDLRRSPRGRAMYRADCKRFTPREITGRTPTDWAWYRIHDGVARMIAAGLVREGPPNASLLLPRCTRPDYSEWTQPEGYRALDWKSHFPKLCGRAKAFYTRLKRELKDGPACTVQLLRSGETPGWFTRNGLHMHVVMPPTERARSPRLFVAVCNHDQWSRTYFHVDGDFSMRHAHVIGADAAKSEYHWRSTRDAIVGIKEWVMANIYIPGL